MTITEFLIRRIEEDEARARYPYLASSPDPLFSPARVLAECAAKRAIVARFKPEDVKEDWSVEASYSAAVEDCMFDLAAVYKDHPDYQEAWVPGLHALQGGWPVPPLFE